MPNKTKPSGIVPAHLDFFAIYNPTLGEKDERLQDEIVYYYEGGGRDAGDRAKGPENSNVPESEDVKNRRLRSVGLAKGMVQFSEGFARGESVDCIETDKSRVLIHNLDADWWLVASISLTCISRVRDEGAITTEPQVKVEYSSREVSPPKLLLEQLLKAHYVFLLHHGSALAEVWQRNTRDKFCMLLKRFWDQHLAGWDVLLHGNPAADIYHAIRLFKGGELGIGVGEEAWGSGEREVLEGFAQRTEGLLDIVVSRFDHADSSGPINSTETMGSASVPVAAVDGGVIFSGLNTIARQSICAISVWMHSIARQGSGAYGVQENPGSNRPHRQRTDKVHQRAHDPRTSASGRNGDDATGIPASIVGSTTGSKNTRARNMQQSRLEAGDDEQASLSDEMMKYLTLGIYGSTWGISAGRTPANKAGPNSEAAQSSKMSAGNSSKMSENASGRFLIGLLGDLEDSQAEEDDETGQVEDSNWRISTRYLFVRRTASSVSPSNFAQEQGGLAGIGDDVERVRAVVYACHPFMFTFLFDTQTASLALPLFYRSFHHQLGPLRGPLLESTNPAKLSDRLKDAMVERGAQHADRLVAEQSLLYDPLRLTVHNTIPSIPDASSSGIETPSTWSRLEALSVHSQILNNWASSRRLGSEHEVTSKTSRGWWVVWMRLPPARDGLGATGDHAADHWQQGSEQREAYLIRKATDGANPKPRQASSGLSFGFGRRESSEGRKGPKAMDGMGPLDVKQYIEALISLSR